MALIQRSNHHSRELPDRKFYKGLHWMHFPGHFIKLSRIAASKNLLVADSGDTSFFINSCYSLPSYLWHRGVVVITTAQLHSTKPELRICAGSTPARDVSEICDGEDLWKWSWLELRLNAFRRSTIIQKQFITIVIIIIIIIIIIICFKPCFGKSCNTSMHNVRMWLKAF